MGRIMEWDEAVRAADEWRRQGRRIVFTNGCFDILHVGHVRMLREARRRGDVLIVGLNTDESVAALKPGRPIVPERERAEVLAALESVDAVVLFGEETPYRLIAALRPGLLLKGGDWPLDEIVGHDLVPVTDTVPYEEGYSTTDIVRRIREGDDDTADTL